MTGRLSDQRHELGAQFGQLGRADAAFAGSFAGAPILAFHLVGQDDARRRACQSDFERVARDPHRGRAADHHTRASVVAGGAEHQSGKMPRLLVPGLRVELQPDACEQGRGCVGLLSRLRMVPGIATSLRGGSQRRGNWLAGRGDR
jgi:hypothetical protein